MPLLLAPAKVNLTLEVLGRQPDGFHRIRSVMVPIALFDRIEVEPHEEPQFSCSDPQLADDNIVRRALGAARCTPARVSVTKAIPVGAGLGGGSSDAGAILRAAMDGRIACDGAGADWLGVARDLGSDVPFFLCGTGALVEGTGERVTPLGPLPPWWTLIVRPRVAVNTADAYRRLDELRDTTGMRARARNASVSVHAGAALQRGDFAAVRATLTNDFHDVVLATYPAVRHAYETLVAAGAPDALLSGSGSCLYVLREDEREARALAERCATAAVASVVVAPFHTESAWRTASTTA